MNPRSLHTPRVPRSLLRTQSDARLTDLARAGSEPAFEAIVSRYRGSLVRYCASVVGDGDAEEAAQDALLKAHLALQRGDPVRRLSPWLHVVAHNTALSYLRARSARPQAAGTDYDWCATVDSSAEHHEELVEVLDALRSLPDRQRDAIVMRELEGRSYDEIAARLGSSNGAVRQLLHRARSSVRERVAALLPLEPLVRWALTGAGGGDSAGGAVLSGACMAGAKVCAALLVPATIAVVATSPAPRVKPRTVAVARPPATAFDRKVRSEASTRPAVRVRVASDARVPVRRRSTPSLRYTQRLVITSRRAAGSDRPSSGRQTGSLQAASGEVANAPPGQGSAQSSAPSASAPTALLAQSSAPAGQASHLSAPEAGAGAVAAAAAVPLAGPSVSDPAGSQALDRAPGTQPANG